MDFGLARALRRLQLGMDSESHTGGSEDMFTIGTSIIKCVKTREATDEIGGFAQYCYLADDNLVIVYRTHRFSLRRNNEEVANCFVSTTEIYVALSLIDSMEDETFDSSVSFKRITFSETEDPRLVLDGEPLFTEAPEILQISAECRLLGDRVEMRNVHIFHESLFELNELY